MNILPTLALLAIAALTACASTPPPTEQVAVSTAAVAQAAGAGGAEWAPDQMRLARDKLARARVAMTAQDYGQALSLAQQAQADAQLAEAKAQSHKAVKAADELQESNRVLREEMERKTPS